MKNKNIFSLNLVQKDITSLITSCMKFSHKFNQIRQVKKKQLEINKPCVLRCAFHCATFFSKFASFFTALKKMFTFVFFISMDNKIHNKVVWRHSWTKGFIKLNFIKFVILRELSCNLVDNSQKVKKISYFNTIQNYFGLIVKLV